MPKNLEAWDAYFQVYHRCAQKEPPDFTESNEHYIARRAALEEGAVASWEERKLPEEVSAIQHAMNLYCRDRRAFMSEYMNQPDPLDLGALDELDAADICRKLNNHPRGVCPPDVTRVTAFVDVGNKILFWCITGWSENFGGHVLDYGTYPRQTRTIFAADDARPSLADLFKGHNEDARIFAGVKETVALVCSRTFPRETGGDLRVERCLVDSGKWPKAVASACRQSPHVGILTPSKGWGVGSGRRAMSGWTLKPGQRRGDHWVMQPNTDGGYGRLVIYDANHWKSFIAKALQTPEMNPGCLQLFGVRNKDEELHRLFAAHLTAEYRSGKWSAIGEQVEQELWAVKPDRPDNHWFDCAVGCAAAASFAGLTFAPEVAAGESPIPVEPKKVVSLKEWYGTRHGNERMMR